MQRTSVLKESRRLFATSRKSRQIGFYTPRMVHGGLGVFCFLCLLLHVPPALGLIFYSTSDPNYNTTAPTGPLAKSGWEWQGQWYGYCGTPIGPHHFIAASHVGGTVGGTFSFFGQNYTTVASYQDPATDLILWEVSGTFPTYAPLYTKQDEFGKSLVVFGRGAGRGTEVRLPNNAMGVLHGWQSGGTSALRWGENVVSSYQNSGTLLGATFDASGGPNEVHLGANDSSGAVFIQDGGQWKLAGINYAVDGHFNYSTSGAGFDAAMFDVGGFYFGQLGNWQWIADYSSNVPSGFYATRISPRIGWIRSIVPDITLTDDAPAMPLWAQSVLGFILMLAGGLGVRTRADA